MKKKNLVLVVLCVGALLTFFGYKIVSKIQEKKDITVTLQTLPKFEFLDLNQQAFTNANLKPQLSTLFIYFNSECDFCHHKAKSISAHLEQFYQVQFLFVSKEPYELIQQFSEQYRLNNKPNITFLYDSLNHFSNRFGATSVPYILIYDQDQNLVKRHRGQLNAQGILKALNQ